MKYYNTAKLSTNLLENGSLSVICTVKYDAFGRTTGQNSGGAPHFVFVKVVLGQTTYLQSVKNESSYHTERRANKF